VFDERNGQLVARLPSSDSLAIVLNPSRQGLHISQRLSSKTPDSVVRIRLN
jgi:hypothetical protein